MFLAWTGEIEKLAQGECRRAGSPGVIAPALGFDLEVAAEIGEGEVSDCRDRRRKEGFSELGALAADDEQLGGEQGDDVGDRQPQFMPGNRQYLDRGRVVGSSPVYELLA